MFDLSARGTTVRREALAGLTTFVTMAYIIVVNPMIMRAAGMPEGPVMTATALAAALGTLMMGLYANRPFALAPYMGENAFVAFTAVGLLGMTWQSALGAIFLSGAVFAALTVIGVRRWLVGAIPEGLKVAFAVGIGLFLAFIGLEITGIVKLGVPGAPVHVGKLTDPKALLAIAGFMLIAVLMARRVPGAILIGILAVAGASFSLGLSRPPSAVVSAPPSLGPVFMQMDIRGALTWKFFPVLLTLFVMVFVDTMGTLIGLSMKAGLLDERGELPDIEKPMLTDAVATSAAACLGTTTTGVYIESATGIEAGGRTGLASVFTAALFLLALFFSPVLTAIPSEASGPALIVVGMLMLAPFSRVRFDDLTEVVPAFTVVALMSFTYNIGIGMTAGFIIYAVMKTATGRAREVTSGLWMLAAIAAVFYIYYPY